MKNFNDQECGGLVHGPSELQDLFRKVLNQLNDDSNTYFDPDIEKAELEQSWIYDVNERPTDYPFFVTTVFDEVRDVLWCSYVTPADFIATAEEHKEYLFEFEVERTDLASPYRTRKNSYQVMAKDIMDAYLCLGQVYSNRDDYTLKVLSCRKV